MSEKRPLIITFLGDINIFYALVLILTYFPFMKSIGISYQIPDYLKFLSEDVIKGLIAIIILIASYGFFKLKKWGYWLIVSIKLISIIGWLIYSLYNKHYLAQYPVLAFIELIFIVPTFKYFSKKTAAA